MIEMERTLALINAKSLKDMDKINNKYDKIEKAMFKDLLKYGRADLKSGEKQNGRTKTNRKD